METESAEPKEHKRGSVRQGRPAKSSLLSLHMVVAAEAKWLESTRQQPALVEGKLHRLSGGGERDSKRVNIYLMSLL